MFLQLSKAQDWHAYSYVIVGSGPAGMALATALSPFGKVLVVEAGIDPLGLGEGYYDLVVTGRDHPTLGTRLSGLGGTSNHWGGHSYPLAPAVFGNRASIAGWPISHAEYAEVLPHAQTWLNLGAFQTGAGKTGIDRGILADHEDLGVAQFQFSHPVRRLGDPQHQKYFGEHPDIDVLIGTRVVDINLTAGTDRAESVVLLDRTGGHRRTIPVRILVLATGGIENARNLLWAGRKYASGNPLVGGRNRLTGKYYVDHLAISPVTLFVDARAELSDAPRGMHGGLEGDRAWLPSDDFFSRHDLPRFGVFPDAGRIASIEDPDLLDAPQDYLGQSDSYLRLEPWFQWEQTPHAGSYVALADELDVDGVARADLHWDILKSDTDAFRRGVILFCGLLSQRGFARARFKPAFRIEDWSTLEYVVNNHHTGTTRMANSADEGVVDADCRVFGIDNLFVAGSSIFPSADFVNPTLSIVALAARLARHLIRTRPGILYFGIDHPGNSALGEGWTAPDAGGVWSHAAFTRVILPPGTAAITMRGITEGAPTGTIVAGNSTFFTGALDQAIGVPLTLPEGTTAIGISIDGKTDANPGIYLTSIELK